MRETYEEKRKIFFEAISQYMRNVVKAEGKDMGLHTFLTVKTDKTEAELIGLGVQKGVKVYGTSRYWFHTKEKYPTVLLGYGALSPSEIHNGIKLLAEAWFG
ncbi:HTH-type transcriptional regulatory protein GabR [compost metagenome]